MEDIKKEGFVRVRVDGEMRELTDDIELEKNKKHSIEVVIDRIVVKEGVAARLSDSLESALRLGEGKVIIDVIGEEELLFSEHHACPKCGFSIGELEPRMFSFNSPFGACPTCDGLGTKLEVDTDLVIPDYDLTLRQKEQLRLGSQQVLNIIRSYLKLFVSITASIWMFQLKIFRRSMDKILYGSGKEKIYFRYENDFGQVRENHIEFEGVFDNVERRYQETSLGLYREQMEKYMAQQCLSNM